MTELPVSVIIPAFNRSTLIARALRSVAAQDAARPYEIIVVDDASTDETAAAARAHGARVIVHDRNRGAAAARNSAVHAASTPWVAFLDSDDEWLPNHLQTLWSLRDSHVLVAGSAMACGDDGAPPRYHGPPWREPRVLTSPAVLYPHNFIPASGAMARRDAVITAGGYDETLRFAEDLDLWIRVMEQGTALVTPRVVTRYGRHSDQKSQHPSASRSDQMRIVTSYQARPWWSPKLVQRQLAFRAWDAHRAALRRGDRRTAAREACVLLGRPSRLSALLALLWRRQLIRRRSSRLTCDGEPSTVVMPGAVDASGDEQSASTRGTIRTLTTLARRPVGAVIVASPLQALVVRALGMEARRTPGAARRRAS